MDDGTGSVTAALFGLAGFEVITAVEVGDEVELLVETTADLVGCPGCGVVARAKDRRPVTVRDLPDRWAAGGDLLVEARLVLPGRALRGAHLDRGAPGDRAAGLSDRAGSGVGVRAGRPV